MDTVTEVKSTVKGRRTTKPRKEVVSIRLDPAIHEQAEQRAKVNKRSFSQFVELVLERYLRSTPPETDPLLTQAFTTTQHGFWSQIDAFEAAANLQTMSKERPA